MGIEPTYPAWKAGVLPLNYTRICNAFTIIPYFPENASSFLKFFIFLYLYIFNAKFNGLNIPHPLPLSSSA